MTRHPEPLGGQMPPKSPPPPADDTGLTAENARLRLAVAHLATYARAVLECRDNGGLSVAHQGFPAYQASNALLALDECVRRVLTGDWQTLSEAQINAAWQRWARRPLFGDAYLNRELWRAAIHDLLWHPPRDSDL